MIAFGPCRLVIASAIENQALLLLSFLEIVLQVCIFVRYPKWHVSISDCSSRSRMIQIYLTTSSIHFYFLVFK